MIRVLLVLMMFGWAGCTQQEEPKISTLRGNYTSVDSIYVPKPKFDPTKHYIISVDTTGFKLVDKIIWSGHSDKRPDWVTGRDISHGWPIPIHDSITSNCNPRIIGWYSYQTYKDSVWVPILDSTWADRKPLLLTPEELKKIKGLLGVTE